jgi:branched-chain amino acid transport system substrate-binding protein
LPRMIAAALLAAAQLVAPTVYSSLPERGPARADAVAIEQGERLALADAGSPLRLVTLDDANRRGWTPERVAEDARRAAQDDATIGYIGEFNSGASSVSLPILNDAGVAMVSPSNTADGLTVRGPGTGQGEPDKYYPTGDRTYFRLAPRDAVQGDALGIAMRRAGCRRAAVLDDREEYGIAIAAAAARHVHVAVRRHAGRSIVRALRRARVDCVLFSGLSENGAVALLRAVRRALPHARLFGPDGIADAAARLPAGTRISAPTLAPDAYPPAGQRVIAASHDVYAAYGYEAMRLYIDAYATAGANRPAIIHWLQDVRRRPGVIGTYSLDRHGDTTLRAIGLNVVRGGVLTPAGTVSG